MKYLTDFNFEMVEKINLYYGKETEYWELCKWAVNHEDR